MPQYCKDKNQVSPSLVTGKFMSQRYPNAKNTDGVGKIGKKTKPKPHP